MSSALERAAPPVEAFGFVRVLAYFETQFRRTWRSSLASNFVYPVLYLSAMGVGLGHLVTERLGTQSSELSGLSYLAFIAPGILASSSMQIAVQESTWPVLASIRWTFAFASMLATPIRVVDVLRGQLVFVAARLVLTSATFTAIAAAFGAVSSPEAVLMVPAGVLCGLAFAAPVLAFTSHQDYDGGFIVLYRVIVVPLFLFSGTFFPVSQLPGVLHGLAVVSPLYQGVALTRSLSTGHGLAWSCAGHVGYLAVLVVIGYRLAAAGFQARLAR